jgi:hypothetical protein
MADKPGVLVAEAELKPAQIQDLADALGDLGKAAAGHDLKYRLRIELGGTTPAPQTVVAEVGRLLLDVSTDLKLK